MQFVKPQEHTTKRCTKNASHTTKNAQTSSQITPKKTSNKNIPQHTKRTTLPWNLHQKTVILVVFFVLYFGPKIYLSSDAAKDSWSWWLQIGVFQRHRKKLLILKWHRYIWYSSHEFRGQSSWAIAISGGFFCTWHRSLFGCPRLFCSKSSLLLAWLKENQGGGSSMLALQHVCIVPRQVEHRGKKLTVMTYSCTLTYTSDCGSFVSVCMCHFVDHV